MNRHRDIEQVLDAWFVDGPSHMPDLLFEAVLDGVERQPQRRRPWATLRVRQMSLQLRLAAAAAIVVLVGGAGFALLSRPSSNQNGVGNTPAPSPSSSVSPDTVVLSELRDEFLGPLRTLPALGPGDRTILILTDDAFEVATGDSTQLRSRASSPGPGRIRLVSLVTASGCQQGDEGIYDYSLSPGGSILTIEAAPDACETRAQTVPGDWQRSACENDENLCLGPLEAGRYASQYFDPFVPATGPWRARFGALSYEVPGDWVNTDDFPSNYRLAPQTRLDGAAIDLWADVVIVSEADPCSETPEPSVGRTAAAISDWLANAEGLVSTEPTPVSIGGLNGWARDVLVDPTWASTCTFSDGIPYRGLFTDSLPGEGFQWGLLDDSRARLYILDIGDGRALVINVGAFDTATWNAVLPQARAIVESMEFPR